MAYLDSLHFSISIFNLRISFFIIFKFRNYLLSWFCFTLINLKMFRFWTYYWFVQFSNLCDQLPLFLAIGYHSSKSFRNLGWRVVCLYQYAILFHFFEFIKWDQFIHPQYDYFSHITQDWRWNDNKQYHDFKMVDVQAPTLA